jgi:ABC-type branched-subunit amino acid transport system ATPase component
MLNVEAIRGGYGALTVLHDVTLMIRSGEAVAVVGANGAGKTTLARTICGLNRPRAGSIIKDGIDITNLPPHQLPHHGIAIVLENRRLFGELTVRENLVLAEKVGLRKKGDAHTIFSWKDVGDLFPVIGERLQSRVELLSGGQQQMIAIARALLLQPDLLIMDEPSTGLAPKVVKDILLIIASLRARGMGLLLIEQNVGIAAEVTERAYVMALGRIVHEVGKGEWQSFLSDDRILKAYLGS